MNQQEVYRYFRSHDFKRALSMTLLMLGTGVLLYFLELSEYIIGVCIGILLTSFSDLQGSYRHRTFAMLLSTLVSGGIMLFSNLLQISLPLLLLFICLLSFSLSMLAVYGQRGSFFAFAGLLCIVLSLIETRYGWDAVYYAATIVSGGLLYFVVSTVYHFFTRKNQTNEQLGELAKLTSNFFKHHLDLAKSEEASIEKNNQLLDLQVAITEKQDELRTLILADRKIKGKSSTRNRQMLLLIELIDLMELAIANPQQLWRLQDVNPVDDSILAPFREIAEGIANRMEAIANQLQEYRKKPLLCPPIDYKRAHNAIGMHVRQMGLPEARESALQLRNLIDYYQSQESKLNAIERLLSNVTRQRKLALSNKQQGQFLKKEDYKLAQIKDNLTIKSPIFRHALRIAIAMTGGYSLALLLPVEKPYWVLLTIIVIMRPSYGLTKSRSLMRVYGTLIGVVASLALIQLSHSILFYVTIASISMVFAFSLLQRNYILSSVAVTLNVVFVFSLIDNNLLSVIAFRLIDTIIGAVISVLIYYFFLPYWEYKTFRETLYQAILHNRSYLQAIVGLFSGQEDETNYRLKRKEAFVASSNLNASFQRYSSDPKSKQLRYEHYYELVVINQSILSTLSNLGNFIKKRDLSRLKELIENIGMEIDQNFQGLLSFQEEQTNQVATEQLESIWTNLEVKRNQEIEQGKIEIEPEFHQKLQEVQLIRQELNWLNQLTKSMQEKVDF